MTTTYLGSMTLGAALPLPASLSARLAAELDKLYQAIQGGIVAVDGLKSQLDYQASAVLDAKVSIRVPAVSDFEISLGAINAQIGALSVQVTDPSLYLSTLTAGIAQCAANIAAISPPSVAISGQLGALTVALGNVSAKISAVDLQLELLDIVASALLSLSGICVTLSSHCAAVIATVASLLAEYLTLENYFGASGVHLFTSTATVGTLGGELAAALPGTGLGAGTAIHGPVLIVETSNGSGMTAVDAVFKTS